MRLIRVIIKHVVKCKFCGMRWTFMVDMAKPEITDEEKARVKEHADICPGRREMA